MKTTLTRILFCVTLSLLILATHGLGAVITWDTTAYQAVSASDISNVGTQVSAISFSRSPNYIPPGGPVTVGGVTWDSANIVNGVSFTVSTSNSNIPGVTTTMKIENGNTHGTGLNSYLSLFTGSPYLADASSGGAPITFSGLTPGQTYQLQIWAPYYGGGNNLRVSDTIPTLSGGHYNSANQSPTLLSGTVGGATPQYALGTFTAVGTTQNLYWYGDLNNYGVLGAFQLRAVPEPSTIALLAVGTLAMIMRRRFRVSTRPELVAD